ncbi:SH3 domain-containing protein [Gemmatimonas sp.]|uniref:SH3 domain-containing protein n=1 Tax=Gemmatimonas sp. TaxID=1962908 RepID=UPI00286C8A59|nr:SH3 domain-containing protein [Gemmatimonas sp.]
MSRTSLLRQARVLRHVRCALALLTGLATQSPAAPLHAQPSPTAILDRLQANGNRPIDFHAATFPDTVYVGQQVTYQVAVLLSESARARLRRNPEFLPPELRGLLAYELGTPRRVAPRSYGGGTFEAHVFQRALFAVAPGTLMVPAPQLSYTLPQSSSYFSREERYIVRAESAQLVVKPLPDAGRPQDYTGAVGVLRASVKLDSSTARVGDPLVLTMRVDGTGNVKLLPRPVLEVSWASTVPGTERVSVDTSGAMVRGYKEFDWILTPTQAGSVDVPTLRYSYFDPYRGEYAYAETAPSALSVDDGTLATAAEGDNLSVVPLREWRGASTVSLAVQLATWRVPLAVLLLLAPLPWLAIMIGGRVGGARRARNATAGGGGSAAAPRVVSDDAGDHARYTRRTLLGALAQRLNVSPQELVSRRDVERTVRRRGVTRDTTKALLTLLDALAEQGFSDVPGQLAGRADLTTRADALLACIDTEAVTHARAIRSARHAQARFALFIALGAAAFAAVPRVSAALQSTPTTSTPVQAIPAPSVPDRGALEATVTRATALYAQRQYSRSAELFAEAVHARPTDADLLANWGAAAWAAGDTVAAVIAWQRAARLEPVAVDLQERLTSLPAGARGGVAEVPMIPVPALVLASIVAWLLGWILLAVVRVRRRRGNASTWMGFASSAAVFALLLAVGTGAAAAWGFRELDATGVLVVRRPETMRTAPGSDANAMGGVATGDVVRVEDAAEGWLKVLHADGRRGWLPAGRTIPLVSPAVIR